MQQKFAVLAAGKCFENLAPKLTQISKPRPEIFRQQLVNLAAQVLRESGTFSGSGDGDLQVAPADHRSEEEIAIGNVVDAVAQDASLDGSPVNGCVHLRRIG